ncbi:MULTISPECIES: hypothetical protein [unclassified Nodularia (in: cyanobacteria)]|uniref:hypothetical protein n=1 Tax=unclassified Nodularia (in: cyanobacteria) TaxID=2656917 RepID=UPI001882C807|nr:MULTISPECIES: hypothetical protein [unclassified Nodularia (in: cyanobacteria)]MBE9202063.1 hypothetical protein [Nodularia sp. LEGE 06071]MCC2696008.1 hypothetical protein [Nodularia sp. LEGE 04288]
MSNNFLKSGDWAYVAKCGRLLYWTYFKPFTLENWLSHIHPELKPIDDPFDKRAEFSTNSRLRRYADQVWWLSVVVPILAVLLAAPVYTLASGESFNWFRSCAFFAGWFLGRVLGRVGYKNIIVIVVIVSLSEFLDTHFSSRMPVDIVEGVAVGLVTGLVGGVALGVAIGLAAGVSVGVAGGILVGVAGGVSVSVAGGVLSTLLVGLVSIVTGGLGLAGGLAAGLAWILGVLRMYFWLPELLWTLILFFSNRKRVDCLRYLPPRFDERIILPLPFMDRMIVEAYQENPAAASETINYLISYTNQQKVATKAITEIAIDSLNRCQRLSDIIDIDKQLAWIPSPPPKELGTVFYQFLDISEDLRALEEANSLYVQYELLNTSISALQELSNSLASKKNTFIATKFSSIVQRWLTILERAKRTLEETA